MGKKQTQKIVGMGVAKARAAAANAAKMPIGQDAVKPTLTQEQLKELENLERSRQTKQNDLMILAKDFLDSHRERIETFINSNVGLYIHMDDVENPMALGMHPMYKRRVGVATITPACQNVMAIINYALDDGKYKSMQEMPDTYQTAGQMILSTVNDITHIVMTTTFRRKPEVIELSFKIAVEENEEKAELMLRELTEMYKNQFSTADIKELYYRYLY